MTDSDDTAHSRAMEMVYLRNQFYRDSYRRVMRILLLSLVVTAALLSVLAYVIFNPPEPKYFAVTPAGRITPVVPLDQPNLSPSAIVQWAQQASTAAFSYNFVNYRQELQAASQFFTAEGWGYFIKALQNSRNLNTINDKKLVVSSVVTKTPVITWSGNLPDGSFAWRVQLALLVTYQSPSYLSKQNVVVSMLIKRVKTIYSARGIGIQSFVVGSDSPVA